MIRQKNGSVYRDIFIALTTAILTSSIGYYTFSKQYNSDEKFRLNQNLNKLLDINLQYPFLEDSTFIAWWNKHNGSNKDSALRYQTYCEYVFNFVQDVCEYYDYDKEKIGRFIDVSDLIALHRVWWKLPDIQNYQDYDPRFKKFIDGFYK
jgi:hypothetical protein